MKKFAPYLLIPVGVLVGFLTAQWGAPDQLPPIAQIEDHTTAPIDPIFEEGTVSRDSPEALAELARLKAETAQLQSQIASLQEINRLLSDETDTLEFPDLDDQELGLTFKDQVVMRAAIERFQKQGPDAVLDDHEARRRSAIMIDILDKLIGSDQRKVVQEQLWSQYRREFDGDMLRFSARAPFRQQLFGYLCYPCEEK